MDVTLGAYVVNGEKIRMVERAQDAGFVLEALQAIRVAGKYRRQNLDGDRAIEPRVARAIHFSHAARTQGRLDFVRPEFRARVQHAIPRGAWDFGTPLRRRANASTSPMPPALRGATISYGPNLVLEVRAIRAGNYTRRFGPMDLCQQD